MLHIKNMVMKAGTSNDTGSNSSNNIKWSNQRCSEIASIDAFPAKVHDIDVQKNITRRFLDFYNGGQIPKGLSISDIIFATLSIMPLSTSTEKFIWSKRHYDINGTLFFLTPDDKLKAEIIRLNITSENIQDAENIDIYVTNESKTNSVIIKYNEITHEKTNVNKIDEVEKNKPETTQEYEHLERTDAISKGSTSSNKCSTPSTGHGNDFSDNNVQNNENSNPTYRKTIPTFPLRLKWFNNPKSKAGTDIQMMFGLSEHTNFFSSCTKLLETWSNPNSRIELKYFLGFVALTLMRATTKRFKHLSTTFSSEKHINNYVSLTDNFYKKELTYYPPHKRCIKQVYKELSKTNVKLGIMFAKIVIQSLIMRKRLDKQGFDFNELQVNIFKVAVLVHTADYGLGLVGMIQTLSRSGVDINIVAKATYTDETAENWNRLVDFFNNYMKEESSETTHHWARVIDKEYFMELSCLNNLKLAVIFGVFIEKLTKNYGVWQSAWVASCGVEDLEKYKQLGYEMYRKCQNNY